MDRLDSMRIFVAVAEAASFAGAARQLGQSPPAVTRAVAALEERIGARLFHRTTRSVRLTDVGARYLGDAKRILAEIEEAEGSAAGAHAAPRGQLGVTASLMFGRMYVAPILLDFLARFPAVTARMMLADRLVDLMEEGLEVAVRIAHLEDSSLTAVRVGAVRRVICASPAYLAAHGRPRTPADLAGAPMVTFANGPVPDPWIFVRDGQRATFAPTAQLIANSNEVTVAAAEAGRGYVRALSYQIAPQLRAGTLEIVLGDYEEPPLPIHVVHIAGRRASARVRAFVDFAVERLRKELAPG
ncbi:MAG TPA: LysR family transcriptional regulator [Alphaproteobacteria bacterium]|jgi:DNA-binding transcriptional LysR family regulator